MPLTTRKVNQTTSVYDDQTYETSADYFPTLIAANAPLQQDLFNTDVGSTAAFLLSPLSRAITGNKIV